MTGPTRSRAAVHSALRRQSARLRTHISRLWPHMPVTAAGKATVALTAVVTLSAGIVPAAMAALRDPAGARLTASRTALPQLTANTNAPCNRPQPKGLASCFAIVRTPSDHRLTPDASGPPAGALGPADIQSAYKLPSGGGQTVAVVDAGDDPTAESDLATFRAQYGLPPCTTANGCFTKVNQTGQQGNYPPPVAGWSLEISLDLDTVSSACPGCNILLVEANSDAITDLGASVNEAVTLGAKFISNSYGATEYSGEQSDGQSFYDHPGVAVTASTGDTGNVVVFPSADPDVVSVGGTTLTADASVSRGWDETVWGSPSGGEGGGSGCSQYEPQPSFQGNIAALDAACPDNRATADIAADANPNTGLAVYDTQADCSNAACDWVQVGGTSLASPLAASMYALAGTPVAGTYPVTYPYQDPNQSADLFDVTTGSNGSCGNVLCNAGPGWDGPTGLGTPDGVKALQGAPQGVISGQVTDRSTGKPVAGVKVTASPGSEGTSTDANGDYTLNGLATGTYALTATAFEYGTANRTGVQVTAGQSTTENMTLAPRPTSTLSGTVTDGSGHGWPLYAQITISGYPGGPIYTDPLTGRYSVLLPTGAHTLNVTPVYAGYRSITRTVRLDQPNVVVNLTPKVDRSSCTAPGYGWNGLSTDFLGWKGGTAQDGWTVSGSAVGWRFDDPGNREAPPGGDDNFAIADSAYFGHQTIRTTLTSPTIDLSGQTSPTVSFDSRYIGAPGQSGMVELSTDNGRHWSTLWQNTSGYTAGPVHLAVPAGPQDRVRFTFTGRDGGYWEFDNVLVGTRTCVPQPGGLIIGNATDAATGAGIPGVTIFRAADRAYPATTIAVPDDPQASGGFYWLFTPAGANRLTATDQGYTSARQTIAVTDGQVVTANWTLTAS